MGSKFIILCKWVKNTNDKKIVHVYYPVGLKLQRVKRLLLSHVHTQYLTGNSLLSHNFLSTPFLVMMAILQQPPLDPSLLIAWVTAWSTKSSHSFWDIFSLYI